MDLMQSPGFLVNRLAHEMGKALEERLRPYGIGVTTSQWGTLALLYSREGLSQVEIQQILGVEGATVSGVLHRMAKAGLVCTKVDPEDRRIRRVYLTEQGRELAPQLLPHAMAVNQKALEGFGDEERQFFIRLVARALRNLTEG